jgi:hypothetical protein
MKHKVVAFDVDETLGNFTQFSIFGHVLGEYFNKPDIMYNHFNDLIDLYPEIIRPNMVRILNYIRKKKTAGICSKVMIYTNNMGPDKWVGHIRKYFEYKLRGYVASTANTGIAGKDELAIIPPLFDHTIGGFKPNNEASASAFPQRTTKHKTVNEFIRCGRLPADIEICFLDDVEHPKMVDERVYYIKLQPYYSYIPFEVFVIRFLNSALYRDVFDKMSTPMIMPGITSAAKKQILSIELHNLFIKWAGLADYDAKARQKNVNPREIDEIISKYILYHLQQFFRDGVLDREARSLQTIRKRTSSKKNLSAKNPGIVRPRAAGYMVVVDKNSAIKNMRNKTVRKRLN